MKRPIDLNSLSEKQFREDCLLPLFQAMNFQEVEPWHGTNESGKDIVMWTQDPLGNPINYAVVVKKGDLTGNARSLTNAAGTVATQVRQCFSRPFFSKSGHQPRNVDQCWVIASGRISKNARDAIDSAVGERSQYVKYLQGDEIRKLLDKHLPYIGSLQMIREAHAVLSAALPNFDILVTTDRDKQSIKFLPKNDQIPFPMISFKFSHDPQLAEKLRQFNEAGSELHIPIQSVKDFESTIPLEILGIKSPADMGEFTIKQAPVSLGPFTIEKTCEDKTARVENIELFIVRGGSKRVTLQTMGGDARAVRLQIEFELGQIATAVNFGFTLSLACKNVSEAYRSALFAQALTRPGRLRLIQTLTGFKIESESDVCSDIKNHPAIDLAYLELLRQMETIQIRTGTIISLTREITEDDLENIRKAYIAVTQDRFFVEPFTMTLEVSSTSGSEALNSLDSLSITPTRASTHHIVSILDREIDLGAPEIGGKNVILKIESSGPPTESAPFGIKQVRVGLKEGGSLYMGYPRFFKEREVGKHGDDQTL